MANTLVDLADLTDYPGAPFTQGVVDSAVGYIRRVVGWHIAPSVSETVTVDSSGGVYLFLPSMLITEVAEVRDVSGDTPVVLTGWRSIGRGMLRRAQGWPCGDMVIEADITHGYAECPPELLPAIAEQARLADIDAAVERVTIDDFTEAYRDEITQTAGAGSPVVDLFKIPRRTA